MADTTITIRDRGPYRVTGTFELLDAEGNRITTEPDRPVLLCRCGHSAMKPFCDGAHRAVEFTSVVRAETPVEVG